MRLPRRPWRRRPGRRRRKNSPYMFVIVGLGNPGKRYAATRHNLGYRAIDMLAARSGVRIKRKFRLRSDAVRGQLLGRDVLLLKPRTFMNLSGRAVALVLRYYRSSPTDLIVLMDDANLPVGRIRIRPGGGPGGHRGLQSLIDELRSDDFPRVRIGIGAGSDMVAHVLGEFGATEREEIDSSVERAVAAVETIVSEGIERAMDRYN